MAESVRMLEFSCAHIQVDSEASFSAHASAYYLLQTMYQTLPADAIKQQVLAAVGGNAVSHSMPQPFSSMMQFCWNVQDQPDEMVASQAVADCLRLFG